MNALHDFLPDFCGKAPTGYARQRAIVIITHPDTRNIIGRIADEPRVARFLGCSGFARNLPTVQFGTSTSAFGHDRLKHVG